MNTQFIYISNIPNNCKPVLLLHELKNKWARMLYIENTVSGQRDAFVYNPTDNFDHFCSGVQNLRKKVIDGTTTLSVYFVWFPPANVFITTMIPSGTSMLSYLFVENLHKDVIPTEIIFELPLQVSDIKNWDIAERPDKCAIIKLPMNCNNAMRSFVLGTLRSRPVRGVSMRASELIISEQSQLSSHMVPRSFLINEIKREAYLSNFMYLHDIPATLTAKMLIETAKVDNIRGVRVFFVETNNNMKYGFLYVPRSLPNVRFMALHEKMKAAQYTLLDFDIARLKIEKTWFQPYNADPPCVKNELDGEMVLTQYLYLAEVPPGIQVAQLSTSCPWPTKMYLFSVNEISTQVGFVVLRGLGAVEVGQVINYLRNMDLDGARIQVEEVYLHCQGLCSEAQSRPFQLQPRMREVQSVMDCGVKRDYNNDGVMVTTNGSGSNNIVLTMTNHISADTDGTMIKTEFISVDNLPKNVAKAALIFDIGRASDGCIVIPNNGHSTAFLYFRGCDKHTWTSIIDKLCHKTFGVQRSYVCEVYLKTSFGGDDNDAGDNGAGSGCDGDNIDNRGEDFVDTNIVFVYNIAREVDNREIGELSPTMIQYSELLETTSGSKSAFILLKDDCLLEDKLAFIHSIRKRFLRGKPIYADLVQMAPVTVTADVVDHEMSKKYRYK